MFSREFDILFLYYLTKHVLYKKTIVSFKVLKFAKRVYPRNTFRLNEKLKYKKVYQKSEKSLLLRKTLEIEIVLSFMKLDIISPKMKV